MESNGTIVRAGQTPHTRAASWEYGWVAETDGRPRGRHRATRRGAAGTLRRGRWQRHHVLHIRYRALQIAKKRVYHGKHIPWKPEDKPLLHYHHHHQRRKLEYFGMGTTIGFFQAWERCPSIISQPLSLLLSIIVV